MKIGISGPPGVGKSTVADELAKLIGYDVIHLSDYVRKKKLAKGYDRRLRASIVDEKALEKELNKDLKDKTIVEGHLIVDMNLNLDVVVLLYTEERVLYNRMKKRGYGEEKIRENLLAVHLDYFWESANKRYNKVIEVKSLESPRKTAEMIAKKLNLL